MFEAIRKAGFVRVRVDGEVFDVETPELVRQKAHHIEAIVDRIVVRQGVRSRLAESIKLAVKHGDGLVMASHETKEHGTSAWQDMLFSTQHACPNCKIGYDELEPRSFSFNSPYGACPVCEGLGSRTEFDAELVCPTPVVRCRLERSCPGESSPAAVRRQKNALRGYMSAAGIRWNTPFDKMEPRREKGCSMATCWNSPASWAC